MKPRILLIDDEALVRNALQRVLERAGYEVVTAPDGQKGVQLFQELRPDLVITDIIMPDKEGIQTTLEIRALQPDARIIVISGGGRTRSREFLKLAQQLTGAEILAKPFEAAELLTKIRQALDPPGQ
jgi:DNA-binding response OmpR family regulator